jgi:hypothetical protein
MGVGVNHSAKILQVAELSINIMSVYGFVSTKLTTGAKDAVSGAGLSAGTMKRGPIQNYF